MTLIPYDPDRLDALALRLFDLAAIVRQMANSGRESGVESLALHDKKALEHLGKLEDWAHKSHVAIQMQQRRMQGVRRAQAILPVEDARAAGRPKKTRKK